MYLLSCVRAGEDRLTLDRLRLCQNYLHSRLRLQVDRRLVNTTKKYVTIFERIPLGRSKTKPEIRCILVEDHGKLPRLDH